MYHRYGALLERRCRTLMRDDVLGEDAVQELLATLLRRGEGFRQAGSPYRWLCRAVDRTCLDLLRRSKRVRDALATDDRDALDPIGLAPSVDPEARLAALQSLMQLDVEEQSLAIMLFLDGMSQGAAAEELGLSRVTINKRAQLIRHKLGLRSEQEITS